MSLWCYTIVACVAVVAASQGVAEEAVAQTESLEATARTFSEWGRTIMEWMGYDYDDYDDYDYDYDYSYYPSSASAQVGYGLPAVGYHQGGHSGSGSGGYGGGQGGGHGGGHQGSSYSSYSPYQAVHHQPQHFAYNARKDDYEDTPWSFGGMAIGAAAVAVPIVLLASALPTSMLTLAVRRRSFEEGSEMEMTLDPSELPLMNTILEAKDFTTLLQPRCQRKLFCEITKIGESEQASFMQRAFYYLAMLTPDPLARRIGLVRTFRAARLGDCEALVCQSPGQLSSLAPPAALPPSNHLPEDPSPSPSPPEE